MFIQSSVFYLYLVLVVVNPPANVADSRDSGLIFASGRSPGEKEKMATLSSILTSLPMDGGDWRSTVHGVTKSQSLSDWAHTCYFIFKMCVF